MTRTEYDMYFQKSTDAANSAVGMTLREIKDNVSTREERNEKRKEWNEAFDDFWKNNFPSVPEGWNYHEA